MNIKINLIFLICFLLFNCSDPSNASRAGSLEEAGNAYLIGKDISLWGKIPNATEDNSPLKTLRSANALKLKVMRKRLNEPRENPLLSVKDGKEWLLIRLKNGEKTIQAFVDYSKVYADSKGKILLE